MKTAKITRKMQKNSKLKRIVISSLLIAVMVCISACGKESVEVYQPLAELPELTKKDEPLLGVYSGADKAEEILFVNADREDFRSCVKVQVPDNYAISKPDSKDELIAFKDLKSEEGFEEMTFQAKIDGRLEEIKFKLISEPEGRYEEIKMQTGNYDILMTESSEALYFVEDFEIEPGAEENFEVEEPIDFENPEDLDEFEQYNGIDGMLNVYLKVSEESTLHIIYQGPVLRKIGHNALALNLCSLVGEADYMPNMEMDMNRDDEPDTNRDAELKMDMDVELEMNRDAE